MSKKTIPTFDINTPGGGEQKTVNITKDDPVYSSYTGNLIGYGPIGYGVRTDAPLGHPNYGKSYHVIEHVSVNNSWMAHNPSYGKR